MTDEELLQSTRLYTKDRATGETGYNLAAVMLLGKDDVIADVVPAYITDAIFRRVDIDRYDDREVIKTNLIESYERLMEFGRKHLPDKFYLEKDQRKSLRNIITREMIANTLIHREYTSSYQAKFVIERNRMYVENANRATQAAQLTPDIIEPNPKNPIIASFFRNIGYADQLGSGVRNLFKYCKIYSGEEPVFDEGDVFRITVPLDESLGGEKEGNSTQGGDNFTQATQNPTQGKCVDHKVSDLDKKILEAIEEKPSLTQTQLAKQLDVNLNTVKYRIKRLMSIDLLERVGSSQKGHWVVK